MADYFHPDPISDMAFSEVSDIGCDGSLTPVTNFTGFTTCNDYTAPTVYTHLTKGPENPLDNGWIAVPYQSRLSIEVRWRKVPQAQPKVDTEDACIVSESKEPSTQIHVRWRLEKSMRGIEMNNCYYTVGLPPSNGDENSLPLVVSDARSIKGQCDGAILTIKHLPSSDASYATRELTVEVDDHVKILTHELNVINNDHHVMVQHIRSGRCGLLRWSCFFPVGTRQLCGCGKQNCRCYYDDYKQSKDHFAVKVKIPAAIKKSTTKTLVS